MLDALPDTRLDRPHQDAATAYDRCQAPSGSRPVWCVVAAKPKAERLAHAELHRRGFQAYLPLITTRWRDRTWHTSPLFSNYLFVRLRLDQPWNPIRYAPGVFSLLCMDGKPSIVARAVIEALRAGEALRASPTQPTAEWAPGMPCRPRKGHALEGHDAVVLRIIPNTPYIHIAIMMLGHLREVAIPPKFLEPRGEP